MLELMYDVLIVGLGCAGYTAAIYCARYKLSVFIVGSEEGGMGVTAASPQAPAERSSPFPAPTHLRTRA